MAKESILNSLESSPYTTEKKYDESSFFEGLPILNDNLFLSLF